MFIQGADWILNLNAPRHSRIRSLIAHAFTARRIAGLEPAMARMADDLLDTMADHGADATAIEFMQDFAYLPAGQRVMDGGSSLYLRLSVTENLECFADIYEVPDSKDRIDRALRAVNVADRANDACGTLSKGLRQRAARRSR